MNLPLATPTYPNRLPPFIGRQADLQRVFDLLQDPSTRLVTVLGPGGIGKSRFALEVSSLLANRFQHGTLFIPLAPLNNRVDLLPALAKLLGVAESPGVLQQVVLDHLSTQHILLLFDNFEHLLDEA